MTIWQADFYKYPSSNTEQNIDWELLICDQQGKVIIQKNCLQSQVNSNWLVKELLPLITQEKPEKIQVFRPQSLNLLTLASKELNIPIEATRHTSALKQILTQRHPDWQNSLKLDQPPPLTFTRKSLGKTMAFCDPTRRGYCRFFPRSPHPPFTAT